MTVNVSTLVNGFQPFGLCSGLQRGVEAAGFTSPTPVQAGIIPAVLDGRDVMGLAETGTGKTAAFALPIMERLFAARGRGRGPRVLIVAPTRELVSQICAEIQMLARFSSVKVVTVFGGVPSRPQIRALRGATDILVACPGRLLDLMGQGAVRLDQVEVLVLDEADHMFDMGFLPDIRKILAALPGQRQNLLFSATMPPEIRGLADRILKNPHVVELGHSAPAATIEHALCPVQKDRKVALLEHLMSGEEFRSAIVFLRTKHRTRRLAMQLSDAGHAAVGLQGNMSQSQRNQAMQGFRNGRYKVLVATDIAARGIDVAGVSHVINFDVPNTPDAYTHRIGRTGRAECKGTAYTFVCGEDAAAIKAIERRLGRKIPQLRISGFDDATVQAQAHDPAPRNGKNGAAHVGAPIARRNRGRRTRRPGGVIGRPGAVSGTRRGS